MHVEWYVSHTNQIMAFGYVSCANQIAAQWFAQAPIIVAFGYLTPITAFRVCILHQSDSGIRECLAPIISQHLDI